MCGLSPFLHPYHCAGHGYAFGFDAGVDAVSERRPSRRRCPDGERRLGWRSRLVSFSRGRQQA